VFKIKVAIIGAGTSGMSCAIELERNGISPDIFERNNFVGEYNPHVSAFLGIITRPVADPVKYINENLGIKINSLNKFKKVIHYTPNNQVTVTAPLGDFFIRGKEKNSIQWQLYSQIKTPVNFKSFVTPEELEDKYDYVVVADGHWAAPTRYGIWNEVLKSWLKGGIFEGDFEVNTLKIWLNKDLNKGTYSYLVPYNSKKAVIAHVVQGIEHSELEANWNEFLENNDILKKNNLTETWELPHHSGIVTTHKVRNVYFVGASGGGAEPFLGFGQFNAIYSGVMAAKSIVHGTDINLLLNEITRKSQQLLKFRSLLNSATNKGLDTLLTVMKIPGIRSLAYRTHIDVIKYLSKCIEFASVLNKKWSVKTLGGK
jgi:digeranylgeranylglycerophospholipid reductase